MTLRRRAGYVLVGAAAIAPGVLFTALWISSPPLGVAFDLYQYYLPNILYAVQRFHAGGSGLLWNAYQHCGQPFFGISSTGMLYPFNVFYLVLNPDLALRAITVLNFSVGGLGMYALGRELGIGRGAAVVGAAAFELGTATVHLSTWGPQMGGPWAWLPAAMLFCERVLRMGRGRDVLGLGLALALALLPGFPQVVFLAYQLIALRVLFECASRRDRRAWRGAGLALLGLALGPLLAGVAFVPAVETARLSVRGGRLSFEEIRAFGFLTWDKLRYVLAMRMDLANPFVIVPCVVAGASWLRGATRRVAAFYTLAGGLFLLLGLGATTPLFSLYIMLPFGGSFRQPMRLMWITSFCLAVLAALGADAIVTGARDNRLRRVALLAGPVLVLAGMDLFADGLRRSEWILGGAVLAAAALGGSGRGARRLAQVLVVAAPILDLLGFASPLFPPLLRGPRIMPIQSLVPDAEHMYGAHAGVFAFLRQRMTAQDRIFMLHQHAEFGLMPKSAALFGVPSAQDYEPQASRRAAEYVVRMRSGAPMTSLNQYYIDILPKLSRWFSRPLLDLAAVRYVVADVKSDNIADVFDPPLVRIPGPDDPDVVVYENPRALPRARWVPRARVVQDAEAILAERARPGGNPEREVLLEAPPTSGSLGTEGSEGEGDARIVLNEPEHVIVQVSAPARGFLQLADQYDAGWSATVDGAPAPIYRADFLFRAVEVPAGRSTVEFRYMPISVAVGAGVTVLTVLAAIGWAARSARLFSAG